MKKTEPQNYCDILIFRLTSRK